VIPGDAPVVLITDDGGDAAAADAARELKLIGIDNIAGHAVASALDNAERLDRVTSADAVSRATTPLIDVRNSNEWSAGHAARARHIPFPQFVNRMDEFPREPFFVMCQTGARSAIAASVLRRAGLPAIDAGGIIGWQRAGGSVVAD
jgi:hydroxyacylglutathione hydrolase